jgi:hypothetical protein
MLETQQVHQMPHAVSTDHYPLPSITAWPYGKQDSSSISHHREDSRLQSGWAKASTVTPPTPPADMNNYAALGAPIYHHGNVNSRVSDYHTVQNSYLPPISKLESPQSQRRASNTNGFEGISAMSSPQGSTTTSISMNVPETVLTPQQDIAELTAEVRITLFLNLMIY